ncbi:MAB_1171c family putative transporter [Streptomyces sp. NPDC005132]|uniref:MAB_1171c family putative transporter n=1 Tax=Streptomyces sp. NPDC005132 TaxID=3154294 RepID=UPI0033A76E95
MSHQHGPNNEAFYICGISLLLICLFKVPALLRRRRDPLLSSVVLLLLDGGFVFFLSAPESISAINRATGIVNFAAPVAYSALAVFGGANLLLLVNWRPSPPEQRRRASRICVTAYSLVVVLIIVFFWLGDAPVEQVTLFDWYYADTPWIREMILTYLLAQGVATTTTFVLCWRWSKEVDGFLRAGLQILVPGYLLHVCYDVIKLVAIYGRWTGRQWDFLVDQVAPQTAAPSAALVVIGFTLPLAGPRMAQTMQALKQLRDLGPLWRELKTVPTPGAIRTSLPLWSSPSVRLTRRRTSIFDALLTLAPAYDSTVRDKAYRAALDRGDDTPTAEATADATMIVAARVKQQTGSSSSAAPETEPWRPRDLVPLSRALTSPFVSSRSASPQHYGARVESRQHD